MSNLSKIALVTSLLVGSVQANAQLSDAEELALIDIMSCLSRVENALIVSGCNVKLVNGNDQANTSNGTGNLILGYNQAPDSARLSPQSRQGSHNLVIGDGHDYQHNGSVLTGHNNTALANSVALAGHDNTASGLGSVIWGGGFNEVAGDYASILGGAANKITPGSDFAVITGGVTNRAKNDFATVLGGRNNRAIGVFSLVAGGEHNQAQAQLSTIVSGRNNTAPGYLSSVLGGDRNQARGEISTVGGGKNRAAPAIHDFQAGYFFTEQ